MLDQTRAKRASDSFLSVFYVLDYLTIQCAEGSPPNGLVKTVNSGTFFKGVNFQITKKETDVALFSTDASLGFRGIKQKHTSKG